MQARTLTFGCRRDPDDAFRFHALATGKVDTEGLKFELVEDAVGGLCERATRAECDVSVLPLPAYGLAADRYRLTTSGFQVGDGYGPLIVSSRVFLEAELNEDTLIHVPGLLSTAHLVLRLYSPTCKIATWSSEDMLQAVVDKRIETAVVTDQSQISFGHHGVYKIEDLGEIWKFSARGRGLPIVLTGVAVRRDLGDEVQLAVQRVVKRSILWGVENREDALAAARRHARGVNDWMLNEFVRLYVTPASLALDANGLESCSRLLAAARELGLFEREAPLDPIADS